MKSGKDLALIHDKVSAIGYCLDTFSATQFNTVMTTLNLLATKRETQSGRKTGWITLTPPTLVEAISLFGDAAANSSILRRCIADCNGHPRSLETLKVVWDTHPQEHRHYDTMIQRVGGALDSNYSLLSIHHIRAALRGRYVGLNDTPDGIQTYAQCLEQGIFLNTADELQRYIPRISALQMLAYVKHSLLTTPKTSEVFTLLFLIFLIFVYCLFSIVLICFANRTTSVPRPCQLYFIWSQTSLGSSSNCSMPVGKFCTGMTSQESLDILSHHYTGSYFLMSPTTRVLFLNSIRECDQKT